MDEKEKTEIGESEDTGEGDKPKTPKATIDANTAAERMEKASEKLKVENDRADEHAAQKAIGGGSEAGQESTKPKKLTDTEYADQVMSGSLNKKDE
ncbi:hypothetical protein LCGC14_2097050 [marine sediment metagenome]|uniref:Uncharacterized protein n=1 Tax=marine sediment metagenome TaxID=412755 RepID=A0A0F9GP94_9ZZZZ